MARIPKNELAVKAAIAEIIRQATGIIKPVDNIRLKGKQFDYQTNSTGGNLGIKSEAMTLWLTLDCTADYDCTALETAINTAQNPAFNGLQIVAVRESAPMAQYVRYYEIKVN